MKLFKLTTLALASSLFLAGCGGDADPNPNKGNGGDHAGETQTNLSDLDQAKEIINTAKLFISDKQAIQDAYEGVGSILSEQQIERLGISFQLLIKLQAYMKSNNLDEINADKLNSLLKEEGFQDYFYNIELMPGKKFKATFDNNDKFSVSGDITIDMQDQDIDSLHGPRPNSGTAESSNSFKVSYDGLEDAMQDNTLTTNPKLSFGFNSITIGSGSEKVSLTASTPGIKAEATFSDKVTLTDGFDLRKITKKGIRLEEMEITFNESNEKIMLVANDSKITAKNFKFAALYIGKKIVPYEIKLTGHLNKGVPKTDVEMSFNASAKENDVKKFIELNSEGKTVEKEGRFVGMVGMTVMLSLKGDVTKKLTDDKAVVIPLDFLAKLKRTSRDEVILEDLTKFSVENKPLHIKGNYKLNSNEDTVAQFVVTQNNARIELNVDAEGEFKTNDQGKLSDIMVNGKDFGDLIDDNGTVKAVFHDGENKVIFQ